MTRLYFIRHATSDFSIKAERERPLTPAGHQGAKDLVEVFQDIGLDQLYSSPYLRTLDTLWPLAKDKKLTISQVEDLREREIGRWV